MNIAAYVVFSAQLARMQVRKRVFLGCILFWMIEGVFTDRKGKFPFHEEGNLDTGRTNANPSSLPDDCSKCTELYQETNREYRRSPDNRVFCLGALLIHDCMEKLYKQNSECVDVTYFALKTGLRIQTTERNCSSMNLTAKDLVELKSKAKPRRTHRQKCKFKPQGRREPELAHCGLFGDPHLRTFTDKRQTCAVAGAWPLLDNEYLAVQVTNEPLKVTSSEAATATSKVTVLFKETGDSDCSKQAIYEAGTFSLPEYFKDGTKHTGPKGCQTSVFKDPHSNFTRLYACHINTTIVIRRVGRYLTFNINMPSEFLESSTGLCRTGCPVTEMVDYIDFFRNRMNEVPGASDGPGMTKDEAVSECGKANLTDFYYDSCVFDLMTTGDQFFSRAASSALEDAKAMDRKLRLRRENSVVYQVQLSPSLIASRSTGTSPAPSLRLSPFSALLLLVAALYFQLMSSR